MSARQRQRRVSSPASSSTEASVPAPEWFDDRLIDPSSPVPSSTTRPADRVQLDGSRRETREHQRRLARRTLNDGRDPSTICIPNASARERMANGLRNCEYPVLRSLWKAKPPCVMDAVVSTCRDLPQPAVGARGGSASDGAGVTRNAARRPVGGPPRVAPADSRIPRRSKRTPQGPGERTSRRPEGSRQLV